MAKTAHYTKGSQARPAWKGYIRHPVNDGLFDMLSIGTDGEINGENIVTRVACKGTREARKIASSLGAQPWNF